MAKVTLDNFADESQIDDSFDLDNYELALDSYLFAVREPLFRPV